MQGIVSNFYTNIHLSFFDIAKLSRSREMELRLNSLPFGPAMKRKKYKNEIPSD